MYSKYKNGEVDAGVKSVLAQNETVFMKVASCYSVPAFENLLTKGIMSININFKIVLHVLSLV